ncbi:hypothetical protein ASG31_03650 [Chryseobacterium sp. Leaf404]|uniref:C2 family cysteine protease n=1 Tax=unclassified Chryseobacterium TaxID=2593645 RepID=UPI0006FB1CD4|nr:MULTISPECIES: C2 family cysteine protease [unclassified Chryseobacterium]KQT22428.1 hypothetical protein ASG31_03650 [Chryseobacterium sp. Leaf404]
MDQAPKEMFVGVINPYALTEAITGRKFDWTDSKSFQILEQALETSYSELFDIKFNSPLYAGLQLAKDNTVKTMRAEDIKVRSSDKLQTINFSTIKNLRDLSKAGIKDIDNVEVKTARLDKGDVKVVLNVPKLNNTITNTTISPVIKDFVFGTLNANAGWTPANCLWSDRGNFFNDVTEFNDPVQGAVGNCYFISAIAALAWATPYAIEHKVRATGTGETQRVNAIQFYTKGGGKDAPSKLIEVTDSTIITTSNNPVYCRSNDTGEIWPAVYEKAFAKWINQTADDKPDITKTAYGDPVKAIAQLNNKTPLYYYTNSRTADQLYGIVRENSMSMKTINPMVAWTYGSGDYSGSNIVANHAYTILGWAFVNNKSYIILRNPWGVTEPNGLNSYQGLISFFDSSFWRPINMIGNDGVFALEINAFKYYFAGMGVAK